MIGNRIVVRVIDQLDEPDIVFIREKKSVCDYVPSVFPHIHAEPMCRIAALYQ